MRVNGFVSPADETRTATWDGVIDLLKKAATLGSLAVCIAMATLFANPGEAMAARSGGRMGGGMGGFSSRSSVRTMTSTIVIVVKLDVT